MTAQKLPAGAGPATPATGTAGVAVTAAGRGPIRGRGTRPAVNIADQGGRDAPRADQVDAAAGRPATSAGSPAGTRTGASGPAAPGQGEEAPPTGTGAHPDTRGRHARPRGPGRTPRNLTRQQAPASGRDALAAAMSEDRGGNSLDSHVRKLIKDLGLWGFHIQSSLDVAKGRTNVSQRGWPDWTVVGSAVLYRELKTERGRLSPEQRDVGDRLKRAGASWDVWRPSDLLSGRVQRELVAISGLAARSA